MPLMRWLTLMGIFHCISAFPGLSGYPIKDNSFYFMESGNAFVHCGRSLFWVSWGAEGIAVAMLIRAAVIFPIYTHVNYRIIGIREKVYFRSIYPAFAGSLLMIIPIIIIQKLIPGISLVRSISVLVSTLLVEQCM